MARCLECSTHRHLSTPATLLLLVLLAVATPVSAQDSCAEPQVIFPQTITPGSTFGAPHSPEAIPCGTNVSNPNHGQWYVFQGTGTILVAATCNDGDPNTGNANFDTKLSVYCPDCANLTCINGVDNSPGCQNGTSFVDFCADQFGVYSIFVHGNGQAQGDFELALLDTGQPCMEPTCRIGPMNRPGEVRELHVEGYDTFNGEVHISFEPACAAADHNIEIGPLEDVSIYAFTDQECGIGSDGSAVFDPGPGSSFFLVVGNDGGSVEGSYGRSSFAERPEDVFEPLCPLTQELDTDCCFVDLDIFDGPNATALTETEEDAPGGATIINMDDDDLDGVLDVVQPGPIVADPGTPGSVSENNLRLISLVASGPPGATLCLDASVGVSKLRVFEDRLKAGPVGLPACWPLGEHPEVLWVEGTSLSGAARDIHLELRILELDCMDGVNITNLDVMSMRGTSSDDLQRIVSTPHSSDVPRVELDPVSAGDVTIHQDRSVTVLLSGTIADSFADIVAGGAVDIEDVEVSVDGVPVGSLNVTPDAGSPSLFRPFAFAATFSGEVTFFPTDGPNVVDVISATNLVGNRGADSVMLEFTVEPAFTDQNVPETLPEQEPLELSFMSFTFPVAPSIAVIDTLVMSSTDEPDQFFTETAADSLEFEQLANPDLPDRILLLSPAAFDPGQLDSIEIQMLVGGEDVGQVEIEESAVDTLEFRLDFEGESLAADRPPLPPGGEDAYDEATEVVLESIEDREHAEASTHGPFVIVVEGPDAFIQQVISRGTFRGQTYPVLKLESPPRWFFADGSQPVVFAEAEKPPTASVANVNRNLGHLVLPSIYRDEGEALGVMILQPVTDAARAPEALSANYGFQGSTLQATITGKGLKTGAVSFGAGVTVTVGGGRNDSRVPVTLVIGAAAAAGGRDVQVGTHPVMAKKFVVYDVDVKVVNFTGAETPIHQAKKSGVTANQPHYWRAGEFEYAIEYKSVGGRTLNLPGAFKRNTVVTLKVQFKVAPRPRDFDPAGIKFDVQGVIDLTGIGDGGSITWSAAGVTIASADDLGPSTAPSVTTTDRLPDRIVKIDKRIQWRVKGPGGAVFSDINMTGPHVLYVLYDNPLPFRQVADQDTAAWTFLPAMLNSPTANRLDRIYSSFAAAGESDVTVAVGKLHTSMVAARLLFDNTNDRKRTHDWVLWATKAGPDKNMSFFGQCAEQAALLQRMANMIGVKAQYLHVYASKDANCMKPDKDQFRIGNGLKTFQLFMDFRARTTAQLLAGLRPYPNIGEGCLVVPSTQVAPTPDSYRKLGTYHPSNFNFTVQGTATVRGDLGVLRKLINDGEVKSRWMLKNPSGVRWYKGWPTTEPIVTP